MSFILICCLSTFYIRHFCCRHFDTSSTLHSGTLVTWIGIGLLTVTIVYKDCWQRHIYLVSAGLTLGLNVMVIIAGTFLWNRHISFPVWWGTGGTNQDGCPLALNETAGDWFFLSVRNIPD